MCDSRRHEGGKDVVQLRLAHLVEGVIVAVGTTELVKRPIVRVERIISHSILRKQNQNNCNYKKDWQIDQE